MRMGLRASLLQATWNYERQQGIGWAWALQPALNRLVADAALRRPRLAEHTAFFNTQPTLASLALGAVARLEEERATGQGPDADTVRRVKSVLGSSLAALGDRLFWFTLRPFAVCLGLAVTLASGAGVGALALWLCYNVLHQPIRMLGVGWGYRNGPAVLAVLRPRLDGLTGVLGAAGAAVVGVVIALMLIPGGFPRAPGFQVLFAVGLGFGLLAAQRARPSPTTWALGVGVLAMATIWFR